jgi:anti-sigma regulatory factor (Ser/Thr protein kinase)
MTADRRCLRVRSDLCELQRADEFVTEFGAAHQLAGCVVFDLNLCLEEVLTNVIRHGCTDGREHWIDLRLTLDGTMLTVEVEDDGCPFNPLERPEPDCTRPPEERPIGGLGIHLVRKLTDGLEYRCERGKNVLVLKKRVVHG